MVMRILPTYFQCGMYNVSIRLKLFKHSLLQTSAVPSRLQYKQLQRVSQQFRYIY